MFEFAAKPTHETIARRASARRIAERADIIRRSECLGMAPMTWHLRLAGADVSMLKRFRAHGCNDGTSKKFSINDFSHLARVARKSLY
ncbi:hypothetical protein HUS70_09050 [Pandoraea nosoerga]|uniref:hypothetical protein n=1 Tax=Pandoraea nosoerga TaxID=2508296 RepID=UPI00123FE8D5|nr:hypothetical protein [Pandoraea nosoerga]MBN4665046.1 hypothetical protein [Pandoraea nosoerga]MBN4675238.1 hypothetical protein [Pandoraea nosoerga]MBN4680789.1 hypothetical protein [Pandoraea nosoerga]MBN4744791.1 hypothetical protein [Pandoraea nosoerga]